MLLTTPPDAPKITPLVSIIVPMRDAERHVRYCVDAILRQSYSHLEIILADVASRDQTPAILDEYRRRDHRVRILHLEEDGIGGWRANPDIDAARTARALNAGLDAAHGEYLAFVDADGVLDRRAVELLLHALIRTGSDMAKGRWERFGMSKVYEIAEQAAEGAKEPEHVTSFTQPLKAYQTVFCKSLRLVGDQMGHGTEARYLQEGHRCRVYRRDVWRDARFDEASAAYLEEAAGDLFARMGKVTDLNVRLYHLLHHPPVAAAADAGAAVPETGDGLGADLDADDTIAMPVTPAATGAGPAGRATFVPTSVPSASDTSGAGEATVPDAVRRALREASTQHDHVTAAMHVYRLSREQGILPERSYAMMTAALDAERAAVEALRAADADMADAPASAGEAAPETGETATDTPDATAMAGARVERDRAEVEELVAPLTSTQRLRCTSARRLRELECRVRDLAISRIQ